MAPTVTTLKNDPAGLKLYSGGLFSNQPSGKSEENKGADLKKMFGSLFGDNTNKGAGLFEF
jgi:hypothetical protein